MNYKKVKIELLAKDPILELVLDSYEPIELKSTHSDYVRLVKIIIGQQLSGVAAQTIFNKLIKLVGEDFTETDFLKLDDNDFSEIGISRAKTDYTRNISSYLLENLDYFENLKRLNSDNQITELIKFKGVGIWTASIFVMSSDFMSDVFAFGDGTLTKLVKSLYGLPDDCSDETINTIVSVWSPYRTLVCNALWHYNDKILTQTPNRI